MQAEILDGNYLGTDHDFEAIVRAIEAASELGNRHAFDNLRESELIPGPQASAEEIQELARLASASFGHAVGTCKMGVDKLAVVDTELRVHGILGLRVTDASVMPQIITGAGDKRVDPHDCGPRRQADSWLKTGDRITGNPDRSLTIDIHHHILPDFFWRATENAHAPVGGLAPLQWSKEASISFMDDTGIDVAVVSLSTPGVHTGDSARSRALARRWNEFSAELVRSRPDRFGGFACLPLPDVDASLEEISYALDVLGLDGFVLFTNSIGVYLGDPALEPVFLELERRRAVVYVHPNPSPDAVAHSLGLPDNLLDFPTDTNRAVAQMHYTNRFARTPSVKYIFSHAGSSVPYLAARFAIIDKMGFIAGGE